MNVRGFFLSFLLCAAAAAQVLPPMPPGLNRGNLITDTNQPGIIPHVLTPGSAWVTLAWDPVTNNFPPLTGYRVYYTTNSGSYDVAQRVGVDGELANSVTVTGLLYSTHYWFVAVSVAAGDSESPYSQEVDWITEGPPLTNFFLTISAQQATSAGGPWTNVGDLFTLTNPAAPVFFWRVGITRTNFNPGQVSGAARPAAPILVPVGAKNVSP